MKVRMRVTAAWGQKMVLLTRMGTLGPILKTEKPLKIPIETEKPNRNKLIMIKIANSQTKEI